MEIKKMQQIRSFIFTYGKINNEASDAKNNFNRRNSSMHYLRYINLLRLIHAKRCDTFAGFDVKWIFETVRKGCDDCDRK